MKTDLDLELILDEIFNGLSRIDHIKTEEFPNLDLYMDQVTTFMEKHLAGTKRYPDDKILTKTMINNYAKNKLLPAPDKKKYSKEHMLLLIYIYYFKGFLSMGDIQKLLTPLTDRYFNAADQMNMQSIYEEVFSIEKEETDLLKTDLIEKYKLAASTFTDSSDEDRNFLQVFSFICLISFDVYLKKQVIEKLIDALPQPEDPKKKK